MDTLTEAEPNEAEANEATAQIKVSEATWEELNQRKTVGDRFEDVVQRVLARAEALEQVTNGIKETEVELIDIRMALAERDDLEDEPIHLDLVVDEDHEKAEAAWDSIEQVKQEIQESVGEDGS
jgi:hypothetical protein